MRTPEKERLVQPGLRPTRAAYPHSTVTVGGRPVHSMLVAIPIVCFVGTLATDIAYWRTAEIMWADISAWLLLVGLVGATLAAIAGLIDFFSDRRIRALNSAKVHAIGNLAAIILSIINSFVHARDAYTSVVPSGLLLSTLVVLILVVTGWNGWTMVYRHGVGVRRQEMI